MQQFSVKQVRRIGRNPIRDQQRARVYKSEDECSLGGELPSVNDVAQFVGWVIQSKYWQNRWPEVTQVEVLDGRRRRTAAAFIRRRAITMPRWSRQRVLVLHELAHLVAPVDTADHGPEFTRVYHDLVEQFVSKEVAAGLKRAFKANDVKVASPANVTGVARTVAIRQASEVEVGRTLYL